MEQDPKNKANEYPTPIEIVAEKVKAYYNKMNAIADFLDRTPGVPAELKIDKHQEFIGFYIDKAAIARLHLMSTLNNCDSLAVYFGLADRKQHSVTGCFVAIDSNRKVVDGHFKKKVLNVMDPEDTWVPPGKDIDGLNYTVTPNDLTLAITSTDLDNHFKR